jgi:hypothetical protein
VNWSRRSRRPGRTAEAEIESTSARASDPGHAAREIEQHYGRDDAALRGYAPLLGVFAATAAAATFAAWRSGQRPAPLSPFELGCMAMATHKVSRLVAKDAVTNPLRAPLHPVRGPGRRCRSGRAGYGYRCPQAVGELLTCPFCIGPWAAATFMVGHTFAPALTRAAVTVLSAVAVSDFLQLAYAAAQQRTTPPEERRANDRGPAPRIDRGPSRRTLCPITAGWPGGGAGSGSRANSPRTVSSR